VRAVYQHQGVRATVEADKLICTVPFSVLRHLGIAPRFSVGKRRAIHEMGYGSLSRITFQVRERYWQREGASGFATTDAPGEIWDASFGQPGRRGLLQLYLFGSSSEYVSRMTEDERIQYARARSTAGELLPTAASTCTTSAIAITNPLLPRTSRSAFLERAWRRSGVASSRGRCSSRDRLIGIGRPITGVLPTRKPVEYRPSPADFWLGARPDVPNRPPVKYLWAR
jgi:hypothetical protein